MKFRNSEQKKEKVVLINRGFWPENDVPGEALLVLSESLAMDFNTNVLTQSNINLQQKCRSLGRAIKVNIKTCKLLTDSKSRVFYRVIESIYFSLWVLVKLFVIRPKFIYVSTDPPLLVPFTVYIFSRLFNTKYTYHLQDIHPEASNIIIKIPKIIVNILKKMDSIVLKNASSVVTITNDMADYIICNRKISKNVFLLENASAYPILKKDKVLNTVIFSGNVGRLQEIPLLLSAIEQYLEEGGKLKFTFMGSGIYVNKINMLANRFENVNYIGYLKMKEAIEVISQHEWGLVSINSQVLKYAFPSKTSTYIAADCKIIAICKKNTSLEKWIKSNDRGFVSNPNLESIKSLFVRIESGNCVIENNHGKISSYDYSFNFFSKKLKNIMEHFIK